MRRTLASVGRGFESDVGGKIREGKQYARPGKYSPEELGNPHEAGVETKAMFSGHQLRYPEPERIRPRLNEMIAELKANLAKPDVDPIAAAAQFQPHFVALRPFGIDYEMQCAGNTIQLRARRRSSRRSRSSPSFCVNA